MIKPAHDVPCRIEHNYMNHSVLAHCELVKLFLDKFHLRKRHISGSVTIFIKVRYRQHTVFVLRIAISVTFYCCQLNLPLTCFKRTFCPDIQIHTDIMAPNSEYAPHDFPYIISKKAFLRFTQGAIFISKNSHILKRKKKTLIVPL